MADIAFLVAIASYALFVATCVPFLRTLKSEAPAVYEALGAPTVASYLWRRKLFMPFSGMILFREYRKQLAPFPKSKAWASWLFLAHWFYVCAFGWFLIALFGPGKYDF